MRNIQELPLADPSSHSLGRLNGQYPGLLYVGCANNVGVVCVATYRHAPTDWTSPACCAASGSAK